VTKSTLRAALADRAVRSEAPDRLVS